MNEEDNKRLGALIFSLAKGDVSALGDIYLIMFKILYAVGNIYFKQKEDIEDAIEDLLVYLYDNASKFRANRNACAWIIKVYQHKILRGLNRRRREQKYIDDEGRQLTLASGDDALKYIENNLFLNDILSRLTVYERRLVVYRYICGYTIREMVEILSKPRSTVSDQIRKIEDKIKKI